MRFAPKPTYGVYDHPVGVGRMQKRDRGPQGLDWRLDVALAVFVALLALLSNPVLADGSFLHLFVFLPVFLFSLVLVPFAFSIMSEDQQACTFGVYRAVLFERPPPSNK